MAPQVPVNRTAADHIPPCYELDKVSYVLINTPSTICVLLYICLGSLSVVIVCGNLFIIISIIYFKQLHTPTNSLILSLAVADLLVGVLVFPFSTRFTVSSCLYYENSFCKARSSFDVTLSTASILNLCCISIDRYYAVCHPLTYRTKMNFHVVVIMILVSWTVSVLVAVGFLVAGLHYEKCEAACLKDVLLANILGPIFSFYLPVIIMLCIYLKIFLVAQRQARSIRNITCQSTKSGATVSKMERKATKTLATVLGVFLMCWTPFFLCFSFQLLNNVSVPAAVYETLNWFALSNSMLNPFIYAFFYSWFRAAFKIIVSGKIFKGDFSNSKLS
ncbi:trace amine-associated receptor 1-like [Anabas testudineus]|uniref:G-protein coupled receptors family 1 profile domain-containing protein n=1 Tax=Anabas testudineus TaxID=64144 RepID=A0A7N6AB77_ANATE|nr:trace amine-associated receptor 1-like [Anabas testudineus]